MTYLGVAMRVLFTNNYSMSMARAGWRRGLYPAHHLYGTASMGPEFDVIDLPFSDEGLWAKLNGRTRGRLGNLEQQWAAIREIHPGAVIYAAQAQDVTSLGLLRRSGLLRVPVVGLVHGTTAFGPLTSAALAGFDQIVAMCQLSRDALVASGVDATRVTVLGWGPDLDFPGFQRGAVSGTPGPIVATGKTGRDMSLLIRALAGTGLPARVYGDRQRLEAQTSIPAHVDIVSATGAPTSPGQPLTYQHTLDDLRSAAVVAIPLSPRYPLHGLTEIADAIACAKPIIVTRAPYFDFDIEAIGCGWWVDHDDLAGWRSRLVDAMSSPERLVEMGQRGRTWAATHWNEQLFTRGIEKVLWEALTPTRRACPRYR